MKLTRLGLLILALGALGGSPAFAALGGDADSVSADQARMKGTLRVSATAAAYRVHEITAASGTRVREYLGSDGKVFGVSWNGPAHLDLRTLLGSYYGTFTAALASQTQHNHRHVLIERSDLMLERTVYQRSVSGRAWAPALLPRDVAATDIQ